MASRQCVIHQIKLPKEIIHHIRSFNMITPFKTHQSKTENMQIIKNLVYSSHNSFNNLYKHCYIFQENNIDVQFQYMFCQKCGNYILDYLPKDHALSCGCVCGEWFLQS